METSYIGIITIMIITSSLFNISVLNSSRLINVNHFDTDGQT